LCDVSHDAVRCLLQDARERERERERERGRGANPRRRIKVCPFTVLFKGVQSTAEEGESKEEGGTSLYRLSTELCARVRVQGEGCAVERLIVCWWCNAQSALCGAACRGAIGRQRLARLMAKHSRSSLSHGYFLHNSLSPALPLPLTSLRLRRRRRTRASGCGWPGQPTARALPGKTRMPPPHCQ
jgi:hypothetical protein